MRSNYQRTFPRHNYLLSVRPLPHSLTPLPLSPFPLSLSLHPQPRCLAPERRLLSKNNISLRSLKREGRGTSAQYKVNPSTPNAPHSAITEVRGGSCPMCSSNVLVFCDIKCRPRSQSRGWNTQRNDLGDSERQSTNGEIKDHLNEDQDLLAWPLISHNEGYVFSLYLRTVNFSCGLCEVV